ncbi:S49 family peptidase [Mesorhizobium sp. M8A.F.Ca.ET.208.01.1.1]|uniref:S49 family peptidase n=1 Tax=unclassified Mesorhizobium TaxID=325217 RepID=UPI001093A3D0|nr:MULTISPECIES: S49 family peptidase [unclassified Mesorhizobium]TGQ95403.1 S49 family peptidase [Mesorhizobium sp. M8A.F.Ca.ET.208.01.1.1]TGT55894.1 S49 family peptidase [Mesorhizobium sp. M8A.F.Ca.ET.167.01.1.1]
MPHELNRLLRAFASDAWFIDPRKADQIAAMLLFRSERGPRSEPYRAAPADRPAPSEQRGSVALLRIVGPILPRSEAITDVSQPAALMTDFRRAFGQVANDGSVSAIVIEIDSPGGRVDLVPETAAMIRNARRDGRPIVAVANTIALSAAYWIASAADEIVVSPSGAVGSIGVYTVHEDLSAALEAGGVKVTMISAGPRKVEGNPFQPLDEAGRAAILGNVTTFYGMFAGDVAKGRGVAVSVVKADPEGNDKNFGGGRAVLAQEALKLGMVDRVATLEETVARLAKGGKRGGMSARASRQII